MVSTIGSQPPMIADELRRQADVFSDLVELQSKLGRNPSERPAPRDREARGQTPQLLELKRNDPPARTVKGVASSEEYGQPDFNRTTSSTSTPRAKRREQS